MTAGRDSKLKISGRDRGEVCGDRGEVCGAQLQPLVDALKDEMLRHSVLHADETPVPMLAPGKKKTHRASLWAYCPGVFEDLKAAVYDFAPSRAGEHARAFLQQDDHQKLTHTASRPRTPNAYCETASLSLKSKHPHRAKRRTKRFVRGDYVDVNLEEHKQ